MAGTARHWLWVGLLAGSLAAPLSGAAQLFSPTGSQFLTLDQDRLYSETLFGRRLQEEFDADSLALAERNRVVSESLTAEELALTQKRKEVTNEEFRLLADAFDEKVVQLREEQDARINALQRRRDLERRVFTGRILPILSDLTQELGALAILDDRAVLLSAASIDVTDRAIARIDEVLGDGSEDQDTDAQEAGGNEDAADEGPGATELDTPEDAVAPPDN